MLLARLIKIPIRTTPICIYLYIINNPVNETKDAQLRNGVIIFNFFLTFHTFIMINKTFTFKLVLSGNKFGFANNIWGCLSANITIRNVVTGIISEPQKLQLPNIVEFTLFSLSLYLHHYFGLYFRRCCIRQASFMISWFNRFIFSQKFCM